MINMFKPKKVQQAKPSSAPNLVCIGGKWFEQTPVKTVAAPVEADKPKEPTVKEKEVNVRPLAPRVSNAAVCGGWLLAGATLAVLIIVLFTKALA